MGVKVGDFNKSISWNLFLITTGCILYSFGMQNIALAHGFLGGGIFGLGMFLYYVTGIFSPAIWYLLLNIPIFGCAWILVSRRFFLYSMFGSLVITLAAEFIHYPIIIENPILAAVAAGAICGLGAGIVLRSVGSDGGLTIVSLILHQRYGIRVGQFGFAFNCVLFMVAIIFNTLTLDAIICSMIMLFLTASVMDNVMSMFNQRKMVFVISEKVHEIATDVGSILNRGGTLIQGKGAYTGTDREVLLVVVHNFQLKRLEEIVFKHDTNAFVIIENTFNVLGTGFSRRRQY